MRNKPTSDLPQIKKNLVSLFPKNGRQYKPQNRKDPWIIAHVYIDGIGGHIRRLKDRGSDSKNLKAISDSISYAKDDAVHDIFMRLKDKSKVMIEILAHCKSAEESVERRRLLIEAYNPALNRPGYIKPREMA